MKSIMWKIVISDDNRIATIEQASGFPQDKVESHLVIIGLLENIKEQHQSKLKVLFNKNMTKSNGINIIRDNKEYDKEDDTETEI